MAFAGYNYRRLLYGGPPLLPPAVHPARRLDCGLWAADAVALGYALPREATVAIDAWIYEDNIHLCNMVLEQPIRIATILEPSKVVMLDDVGVELQVVNKSEKPITLKADYNVILMSDQGPKASSKVLPINFVGVGVAKVMKKGSSIFVSQYYSLEIKQLVWLDA